MDAQLAVRTESVLDAGVMFDVPAAMRLASEISRLPEASQVVIDFVRTRECHDFALAVLLQALLRIRGGPQVKARGLTSHHARVLRYLGGPDSLLA
ncbi:MAG TPA: hypothetical protein VFA20_31285 [Myxococcaceae bacterium]|nr:hypothetical protein [Myxococcaceae bacterium]